MYHSKYCYYKTKPTFLDMTNLVVIWCLFFNMDDIWKFKASVTILADFGPSSTLRFAGAVNTRQKIIVHIINLVYSEFPNRSC